MKNYRSIKKMVILGQLEKAITLLVSSNKSKKNLLISFRFNSLKNDFNSGILTYETYKVESNFIARSLLILLEGFKKNLLQPKTKYNFF